MKKFDDYGDDQTVGLGEYVDGRPGCSGDDEELDDELMRLFGEKKRSDKPRPLKVKQAKPVFKPGDKVVYRRRVATVMFGPYERGSKTMYELRMDDGTMVSAHAKSVTIA